MFTDLSIFGPTYKKTFWNVVCLYVGMRFASTGIFPTNIIHVIFEIFTAAIMKYVAFRDVAQCSICLNRLQLLAHARSSLARFFYLDDGGDTILRNVGSHTKRRHIPENGIFPNIIHIRYLRVHDADAPRIYKLYLKKNRGA
jgi:hypothetical protein